jgi:hypothetical protein
MHLRATLHELLDHLGCDVDVQGAPELKLAPRQSKRLCVVLKVSELAYNLGSTRLAMASSASWPSVESIPQSTCIDALPFRTRR